jgi:Fe-S oxidoreductase
LRKFKIPYTFEFTSIITLYAQWIREGLLPVSSDWNKDLKIKFTVQDPCNVVRKTDREKMADDLRFVVRSLVGEENLVDMVPCGTNNYCCGGGGGALQGGYTEQRRAYGKVKFDQIQKTGAAYVIAPCHNCHTQIADLRRFYNGSYHTLHIWTIICLALGILAENERTYLGPDLANIGL